MSTPYGSGRDERWDRAEDVTITRRRDIAGLREVFTVSDAPAVTAIGRTLVEQSMERLRWDERSPLTLRGDEMRWAFDNCRCSYRVLEYSPQRDAYLCERFAAMGDA